MLIIKQLNNGRFRVSASDYDYNRFPDDVVLQLLWRSFATKQEAEDFIETVSVPNQRNEFVESCLFSLCKHSECNGFASCDSALGYGCLKASLT